MMDSKGAGARDSGMMGPMSQMMQRMAEMQKHMSEMMGAGQK